MWFKLWQCVVKEFKLLFRDIGGLITLFVMPIILVVVVTSIQDSTYQSFSAAKIPVLWIDNDQDSISFQVHKELQNSDSFELISKLDNNAISETKAKEIGRASCRERVENLKGANDMKKIKTMEV